MTLVDSRVLLLKKRMVFKLRPRITKLRENLQNKKNRTRKVAKLTRLKAFKKNGTDNL